MQDRLRESGGTGREIDRRVVVLRPLALREAGTALVNQFHQVVREARAPGAFKHQRHMGNLVRDFLYTADEFRPENQHIALGQVQAVFNLIGSVAEVHGNHHSAGLQDTEVDRKPVNAVHHQDGNLFALADPVAPEHVCHPVCFFIKNRPGDFPAVVFLFCTGLHQFKIMPGYPAGLRLIGVDLHQCRIIRPFPGIPFQQFNNGHKC